MSFFGCFNLAAALHVVAAGSVIQQGALTIPIPYGIGAFCAHYSSMISGFGLVGAKKCDMQVCG